MARTISASVGRGGVNRSDDTVTVQELLNRVPPTSGGPVPILKVDGLCGPKTTTAIQTFQLKQWGWNLADGRVDPAGPTLARLNDFDAPAPPQPGPPPPPVQLPKGAQFGIFRMGRETVVNSDDRFLFFYVVDLGNNLGAVYWLKPTFRPKTTQTPPPGRSFGGSGGTFHLNVPRAIDGLQCPAVWSSTEQPDNSVVSKLALFYPDSPVQLPMNHHLIGPGGLVSAGPPGHGGGGTAIAGDLVFIESR